MIHKITKKNYMEYSSEDIKNLIYNTLKKADSNTNEINWSDWFIGITIYPNNEKKQIGKPKEWHYWRAKTATEAQIVESYFLNKYPINRSKTADKYDYFVFVYKK
jgi:hypothetical protein